MRYVLCIVALVVLATLLPAYAEKTVVLEQKSCPISVVYYHSKYRTPGGDSLIEHAIDYKLASDKGVVAVRFGLVVFNAFDEFMGKFSGYVMETLKPELKPGKEVESVFNDRPYGAFAFERYGTAVMYVDAVRFSDDSVWHADDDEVVAGIRKVNDGFKKENLQEKEQPSQK